ncbi:uncharacterized protein BT62DRAFT_924534 [Guyanagaster necrorhizus]|uniref:Uncharacterized protein n=1 Tax=Guyanagaster necrorhizus TaxID=856835 RepID=A0A9P7VEZ6_9AGAR|nr:uncharacterized protein BT62DRAFT_924534 [Guyanagaster necrorhizus MCA 3950]KAG7439708.1 hypothetical protein BT62DRAFT_924534 [Guyanagaster necrorhizus MCA 3950]
MSNVDWILVDGFIIRSCTTGISRQANCGSKFARIYHQLVISATIDEFDDVGCFRHCLRKAALQSPVPTSYAEDPAFRNCGGSAVAGAYRYRTKEIDNGGYANILPVRAEALKGGDLEIGRKNSFPCREGPYMTQAGRSSEPEVPRTAFLLVTKLFCFVKFLILGRAERCLFANEYVVGGFSDVPLSERVSSTAFVHCRLPIVNPGYHIAELLGDVMPGRLFTTISDAEEHLMVTMIVSDHIISVTAMNMPPPNRHGFLLARPSYEHNPASNGAYIQHTGLPFLIMDKNMFQFICHYSVYRDIFFVVLETRYYKFDSRIHRVPSLIGWREKVDVINSSTIIASSPLFFFASSMSLVLAPTLIFSDGILFRHQARKHLLQGGTSNFAITVTVINPQHLITSGKRPLYWVKPLGTWCIVFRTKSDDMEKMNREAGGRGILDVGGNGMHPTMI